jgi:hypothetical protein
MACPSWMNRGFALGTVLGLLVGGGTAVAWFTTRDKPADKPRTEVVTATISEADLKRVQEHTIYKYLDDAKKDQAIRGCKGLASACEAWATHPANEGRLPQGLIELVTPGFGSSFLKNGVEPLVDPWGQRYRMRVVKDATGNEFTLITTTAPDGTPISQFGIGEAATPKE